MLSVGAFEPGVSASPYQTATSEIVTRPRLTFAVRSRIYLHHKCFGNWLVLDVNHTGSDRMALIVGWRGSHWPYSLHSLSGSIAHPGLDHTLTGLDEAARS